MVYKRRATRKKFTKRRKYGAKRRSAPRRRLGGFTTSLDPSGFGGSALTGAAVTAGGAILNKLMGSGANTQTKTKSKIGTIVRVGENTSLSSFRFGPPMSRFNKMLYRKTEGRRTFYANSSGSVLTQTGRQTVQFLNALTNSDCGTTKTALDSTAGPNNLKVFFGYIKHRVCWKNQSNHVAALMIYDMIPRRGAQNSNYDSPIECWEKGISDAGGGTAQPYIPGSTPFQSPEFRRLFSVLKVTKIYLEPGETHEHTFYRKINGVRNSTTWDNSTSFGMVPGISHLIMWLAYGSIGHEATVGDANPTTVTYMPCRLDYVETREYNAAVVPFSQNTYATVTNLSTTAPANWDFMAESGDVDGDLVNA